MTANIETIKRKIRALLAKANGTDNEHEAAAFVAKANELLEAHQLDGWDVTDATGSAANDPVDREVLFEWKDATPSMNDHKLITALARLYGCRVITQHGRGLNTARTRSVNTTKLNAIGPMSARETTKLMFEFVMQQCKEAGKRLSKQGFGQASKMQLRVVNALTARIYNLIADQNAAESTRSVVAASRALVVVDAIEQIVSKEFGKLTMTKARAVTTTEAARGEAEKVSLHRQVSTGAGVLLLKG